MGAKVWGGQRKREARGDYPFLFQANARSTKTMVEIAAKEPVRYRDICELETVTRIGSEMLLRRLAVAGLIARYTSGTPRNVSHYCLSRAEPLGPAVRAVVAAVGAMNGVAVPPPPALADNFALVERIPVSPRREREHGSVLGLFGPPRRTLALITVAILREVDESTIARVCDTQTAHAMMHLLDPIERDGLLESYKVGRFRVFALPEVPWKEPMERLADVIAAMEPHTGALIEAGRQARTGGSYHGRAFLKRYLRDGVASYKDPGRQRGRGE